MLRVNTCAPQLNHLPAQRLKNLELELLRAIVTAIRRRIVTGLQTVSADDICRLQMFHDEMIANGVEWIFIEAGRIGLFKPFIEFEIEDLKAQ